MALGHDTDHRHHPPGIERVVASRSDLVWTFVPRRSRSTCRRDHHPLDTHSLEAVHPLPLVRWFPTAPGQFHCPRIVTGLHSRGALRAVLAPARRRRWTYLPKIVYSLAHPESVMDGTTHEVAHTPVLSLPLSAAPYYPDAYEFLQAAFVDLSGTDLFWVYYRLAPALAAMFGVLLLATNLRYLGVSGRASALAVLMLIPMILLMGISHRSFGNFTLVRMFQSKCAFIFSACRCSLPCQCFSFASQPAQGGCCCCSAWWLLQA